MKKIIYALTINLLLISSLHAQSTGKGSSSSANISKNNEWQNWAFAGSLIATATTGVLVLAFNNGNEAHAH